MQDTTDRRLAIRDYISDKRETTITELVRKFKKSKSTIRRDLDAITSTTCFQMVPGRGGGIRADEGWYSSSRYLAPNQEELLRRLLPELQPDDAVIMESILVAFGGRYKEKNQ